MNRLIRAALVYFAVWGAWAVAVQVPLEELVINTPDGWALKQDGRGNDTLFVSFSKGQQFINFYAKGQTHLDMKSIFVNGSKITRDVQTEKHGSLSWSVLNTYKSTEDGRGARLTYYVVSFLTEYHNKSYYGYTRATSQDEAAAAASAFLDIVNVATRGPAAERSLTGPDYTGKKYYYGFGDQLEGEMGNEVFYDIKHTNDIFTKDTGGGYIGQTALSPGHAGITQTWADIGSKITANDMYLQYSSGHGSPEGLMVGVSYDEIRDNALSYPAKEIVIFTMACYSGNLVDSFNNRKSDWQDFQSKGRTLYVMSSSQDSEESQTGPGTDPDQPNSPDGSAGSAFGHALWKSLIGYADGAVDGVKDGFISLEEIKVYATKKTQELTGNAQTPAVTGAYAGNLIMDKVPPKEFVERLEAEGGTKGMTDAQIMQKVRELDRELSVR